MSRGLPFTKVEGLGNDFVVVDLRPGRPGDGAAPSPERPDLVRAVCDRHFGVGADGVLAILPTSPGPVADARMRVLHADGSEAEMCGNGIRGVAKVLYESDPAMRRSPLRIETGAGVLDCALELVDAQAGKGAEVRSVAVQMGRPRYTRNEIPLAPSGSARAVRAPITADSMENPHAVIFVDDPSADLRALAERHGPTLELAPTFPRRTNVEFARLRSQGNGGNRAEIDLVVWERGCGITLACGTGACATVAAACLEERLPPDIEVPVHLPGGTLFITVAPDHSGVRMRGPARSVFRGELDLASLA
jgi:diaminopimelate epimerase